MSFIERDFIADFDLNSLNLSDLLDLQGQVIQLIEQAKSAEIDHARAALELTAAQLGIPFHELVDKLTGPEPSQQDTPVAPAKVAGIPKYFHPNDGRTWTGKGKRPKWVVEHIEAGGTLEGLYHRAGFKEETISIYSGSQPETPDALPDPEGQEMPF